LDLVVGVAGDEEVLGLCNRELVGGTGIRHTERAGGVSERHGDGAPVRQKRFCL
jgi:hypothetical protein